jgi:hypothetical protein
VRVKVPTIFAELPEDIGEDWTHGATLVGTFSCDDEMLARSYFAAGDVLINHVVSRPGENGQDWIGPILFNFRHGIELYLKAIVKPVKRDHSIGALLEGFCRHTRERYKEDLPRWVTRPISEFINIDPGSDLFRYGDPKAPVMDLTHWIDFHVLRRAMAYLEWAFQRTLHADKFGLSEINVMCPRPHFDEE